MKFSLSHFFRGRMRLLLLSLSWEWNTDGGDAERIHHYRVTIPKIIHYYYIFCVSFLVDIVLGFKYPWIHGLPTIVRDGAPHTRKDRSTKSTPSFFAAASIERCLFRVQRHIEPPF